MALIKVSTRAELDRELESRRRQGQRIGLVPTMGNLHAGHLSLVDLAAGHADCVVTSIYVNPTQFGPQEDYTSYPRTETADCRALAERRCDIAFLPGEQEIYPFGAEAAVFLKAPPDLGDRLCGASRPGHFDGVLTVVARLLLLSRADLAVFGEKDYQQLLLIERMCQDLGMTTKIVRGETRREPSGLAMSSRNRYLDRRRRRQAASIYAVLQELGSAILDGRRDYAQLCREGRQRLEQQGLKVEYLEIANAATLAPAGGNDRELRILTAAWLGRARLIDNIGVNL